MVVISLLFLCYFLGGLIFVGGIVFIVSLYTIFARAHTRPVLIGAQLDDMQDDMLILHRSAFGVRVWAVTRSQSK